MNYQQPRSRAIIHVELYDLIRLFPSFYYLPLFSLCQTQKWRDRCKVKQAAK